LSSTNLVVRFRKWVVIAIAVGAIVYLGLAIYGDYEKVAAAMASFRWSILVPVCLLTLSNYTIRFAKWRYLTRRLGVDMPLKDDAWLFASGLAMVISPGKIGELLKPYVVRERTGVPMATTTPALVTERLTDAIGMLILAGIGVSAYQPEETGLLVMMGAFVGFGLLLLAHEGLSLWAVRNLCKLPLLSRVGTQLEEMLVAMRTCVAPVPLLLTVLLSVVAWWAECWGLLLVFQGLGVTQATMGLCVFIYAFATLTGGAAPGGLGVSDVLIAVLGAALILCPGMDGDALKDCVHTGLPVATAASILIRVCTLWIGVAIGAVALFKVSHMLGGNISLGAAPDASGTGGGEAE